MWAPREILFRTFSGRRATLRFSFLVNNSTIEVNRAQIEIDAVFESQNPEQIFLFEAKVGTPSSFRIQQLYYPYRTLINRKPVRNFFCFEPKLKMYLFWEYEFNPRDKFDSIKLIRGLQYRIKITKSLSVKDYQNVSRIDSLFGHTILGVFSLCTTNTLSHCHTCHIHLSNRSMVSRS